MQACTAAYLSTAEPRHPTFTLSVETHGFKGGRMDEVSDLFKVVQVAPTSLL